MLKKTIVLVLLGIIVGSVLFVATREAAPETQQQSDETLTSQAEQASTETATQSEGANRTGQYLDYSEEALASAQGNVLLFFHAPWCPQCRELEADIKRAGVPDNTTILKVDYDTNQSLRKKYGVTIQTTVVSVNSSGELIKKFVAYDDPSVASIRDNLL